MAIHEAEREGAFEGAPLELFRAREHLDEAKVALFEERLEKARRHADLAVVNAELARVKAVTDQQRAASEALVERLDRLRADLDAAGIAPVVEAGSCRSVDASSSRLERVDRRACR